MTALSTFLLNIRKPRTRLLTMQLRLSPPPTGDLHDRQQLSVALKVVFFVILTACSLRFDVPGLAVVFLAAGFASVILTRR